MKKFILVSVLLASGNSIATPLKDAACASKINLRHPVNAAGIYFNADCTVGYVLPPQMSNVYVSEIAATGSVAECSTLNAALKMQSDLASLFSRKIEGKTKAVPGMGLGSQLDELLRDESEEEVDMAEIETRIALMDKLLEVAKKTKEIVAEFKDQPAASAKIGFRLPWNELVNSYKRLNGNKIQFVRMPLTASYLTFNREISKVGSIPAVHDYDIPGIAAANSGLGDASTANPDSSSILVGDAYSGQLILSLTGACPFYNANTGQLAGSLSGDSLTAYLNANLNYSFGLQVHRKYTVSYNLGLLVSKIKTRSSSGGFFSTSSHVSEINNSSATDWFTLKNESNDSRFSYELLVSEVKADLMNRAIRDITMMEGFSAEEAPQVAARTKNGAQASAEALQKCPNQYCQAAAIGLQALDAIFGSSSSVSTYINNRSAVATDAVNDNKVIQYYGSSTFESQKRVW